jgi:hypothetical protein
VDKQGDKAGGLTRAREGVKFVTPLFSTTISLFNKTYEYSVGTSYKNGLTLFGAFSKTASHIYNHPMLLSRVEISGVGKSYKMS